MPCSASITSRARSCTVTGAAAIRITTKPIQLAWHTSDGTADAFRVSLYDVTTTRQSIHTFLTVEPHLEIDPAVFESGHYYMFQVGPVAGRPNAASGDFRTIATTYASAYVNPPVFRIAR